jgi:ABC-2 type transport system permease protein
MKAFAHHLAYDFKTGIRDRSKLLMYYLFPLVFFILVGGLMASVNPGFKQTMLPAMVLFAYMCSALLNLPTLLVTARESGVFRSYRINGVPASSIVTIPVISTAVHMAVVSIIICLAGARLYGGVAPASIAGFVAAGALSYAAFAGIGTLIGVVAGNATASMLLGQLLYIPSIILGGLTVPLSALPVGLQTVSLFFPATHCMKLFTGLAMPGSTGMPWGSIVVLGASAIISFILSAVLFSWDSRAAAPNRRVWAGLLVAVPFVIAALTGV